MTTTSSVTGSNNMSADFMASVTPKTTATSDMDEAENRFLKLLTTQLKNQDPLNPLDNAQMTSQMAQISTVNGIEKLNSTLEKMMSNSTDTQAMQAAAMLGHQVLVAGNGVALLENGMSAGAVDLPQSVDSATVTITDSNGLAIRTLPLGALDAGMSSFVWDGKSDSGEQAVAGNYKFSVSAVQGAKPVTADTLQLAEVTGVLRDKAEINLELGLLGNFKMADIRQIY